MLKNICKVALLMMSGLLVLTPLWPELFTNLTFLAGAVILLSCLPYLGSSYKKPVYVFLLASFFIIIKYSLSYKYLIAGVNSMLPIVAILTVLQIFVIPIRMGKYDQALEQYLKSHFQRKVSLFVFLKLITHLLGSFMLFGTVPMLFTIFAEPLKNMVSDSKRFTVTAMSRGFSLVTMWAPGAINVVLALQSTGAKWLQVFLPAVGLSFLGIATSVLLEFKLGFKDHDLQSDSGLPGSTDDNSPESTQKKKILILLLVALGLIAAIVLLERLHVLNSTTRVVVAGFVMAFIWILRYIRQPEIFSAWQGYWGKSLNVVPDLAALFLSIGIFTEVVQRAGLMEYVQTGLISSVNFLGPFSFILIPPVMILLSLVGIHPFISIIILGQILTAAIRMPHHEVYIAISLLLGGVISYIVSPFAGNVLTLAKLTESSPTEIAFKYNGLFSIIFLLEGLLFLLILQFIWR